MILCLSALHYAKDQEGLIHSVMNRLESDGVLVLEIGVADGEEDAFVPVKRSIHAKDDDTRYFPTFAKVRSMLAPYVFKYMGQSVMQKGDPLPRHVYHVQHKRPLAVLFMDGHYAGKSSISNSLLRPDIFRIHGEALYSRIHDGEIAAGEALKKHIVLVPGTKHMLPPSITRNICETGLLPELARIVFDLAGPRDFVLEHYIPEKYRLRMAELCHSAGYFVVDIALFNASRKDFWAVRRPPYKQYEAYLKYLEQVCDIDEEAYLTANPDVAQALAAGAVPSAKHHYWSFGKREKRKLR